MKQEHTGSLREREREDCWALEFPCMPLACLSIWDSKKRMGSRVKMLSDHVVSMNWSVSNRNVNF